MVSQNWEHDFIESESEIFHSLSLKAIFLYNNLLLFTEVCYFLKYNAILIV